MCTRQEGLAAFSSLVFYWFFSVIFSLVMLVYPSLLATPTPSLSIMLKMTSKEDKEYIGNLVTFTEKTLKLLSNKNKSDKNKSERKKMVCVAFHRCLGVSFSPTDFESPQNGVPEFIKSLIRQAKRE